ncbi:MAG: hypothetical protein WAW23_08225 [Candidatus Methanoperedens sp.]
MDKPKNIEEYKKWLKEQHKVEISDRTQTYYDSVTSKIKLDFENSEFWSQLTENLKEYNDEYLVGSGYQLLIPKFTPELITKSFDSFLLKTFRKNIIENNNWPESPKNGWILPTNWHLRINDSVRTLIVVKYLDGVDFLINKIKFLCEQNKCNCKIFLEAREEGYYAAHLYINEKFEIPKIDWNTEKIDVSIEIQITTQLQEVIRKLLHKYYENRRKKITKEDIKWQWDYKGDEFTANYLGHILHYVEGMIMEIRDKQKEEKL